jgi:hypothetical protein
MNTGTRIKQLRRVPTRLITSDGDGLVDPELAGVSGVPQHGLAAESIEQFFSIMIDLL